MTDRKAAIEAFNAARAAHEATLPGLSKPEPRHEPRPAPAPKPPAPPPAVSRLPLALALAKRGFKVFPIKAGEKNPPLIAAWQHQAVAEPQNVRAWWEAYPDANIAIHCAGLLVVDVDVKKGGDKSLAALEMLDDLDTGTLTTKTPTGGRHLFYRLPAGHPGVANSVGKLGAGLDVRSSGGYVVAPGSQVAAGRYVFEANVPLLDAPEWLVERAGAVVAREPKVAVPDAPDAALERAAAWLAKRSPAVEGQGGDAWTFATACLLRDYGISSTQALELLAGDWNSACSPPWGSAELRQKVDNAYRYAQEGAAGKLALSESDFAVGTYVEPGPLEPHAPFGALPPGAEPYTGPPGSTKRNPPVRLSEFASGDAGGAGYVVKGLLSRESYAIVAGPPGAGKTFFALDMGYHVAAGLPWHGRLVKQGLVLYLAYEGIGGMRKRGEALRRQYGTADVPLYIQAAAYNLREPAGRKELAETIAALPEVPCLIIIDTLALALMGGDENSAQDVGGFNHAVQALVGRTGACVLVIHHPPKSGDGLRGSGAIRGAVDTEIEINNRQVAARKQRDFDLGEPIGFTLKPIVVGIDEDDDEVTSCVFMPAAVFRAGPGAKLKGNIARVFDKLCELRPTNDPITRDELHANCGDFLPPRKAALYDAIASLRRVGLITVEDGLIQRRLE